MRLYSAYINMKAAKEAESVFEPDRYVKKIYVDGRDLWELSQLEKKDDREIDSAEAKAEIPAIIKEQKDEIKDIEDVANKAFTIIRDAMLLLHSQLDELKKLVREDEVLQQSGFPIEIANQLEEMMNHDIKKIVKHLHEMAADHDSGRQ